MTKKVDYDLTYDQHDKNHEHIYRLDAHIQSPGADIDTRVLPRT